VASEGTALERLSKEESGEATSAEGEWAMRNDIARHEKPGIYENKV